MPIWALLGLGGVGAYLLMSSSSSGAGVSAPPTNAYGGGGAAPGGGGSGGYGGPTTLGPGGSSTPVGPAAVSTSPTDVEQQAAELGLTPQEYWNMLFPSNPTASGYVGANLAPGARHVLQRGPMAPPPGAWGTPPPIVTPPLPVTTPPTVPGAFFDSTVWAWLAYGPTAPAGAPQPGGGSWILVTALGPDAGAALYPDTSDIYSPFTLPVWVWYPPTDGGLHGVGTSGDTSWAGWTYVSGSDIPVFNSPSPPPAGGYPGSDSWLEMFPNYWVLGAWLAAAKAAAPVTPPPAYPPSPPTTSMRHAHEPRFDPMSRRYY